MFDKKFSAKKQLQKIRFLFKFSGRIREIQIEQILIMDLQEQAKQDYSEYLEYLKLREHKVDIERALLFGQKARVSSIQYTEGVVGHILKNGVAQIGDAALSYTSGQPYFRSVEDSELTLSITVSQMQLGTCYIM